VNEPASLDPHRQNTIIALIATGLILLAGLIHLILTPEHLEEALYLGLLFLANFAGAAAAALGISRRQRWGWVLGALIAGGAYALYFVNGTIGLPGVDEGHLIEPLGLFAKVVEAVFLVICAFALSGGLAAPGRWAVIAATVAVLAVLPAAALALIPDGAEHSPAHDNGGHQASHTRHGDGTAQPSGNAEIELRPVDDSGVSGTVALKGITGGVEVDLELRGLPKPGAIYQAHLHRGTCAQGQAGSALDHQGKANGDHEMAGMGADIVSPLSPVKADAQGGGSSTTTLWDTTVGELLSGEPRSVEVHAVGGGPDLPAKVACATLSQSH